ncbi:twin-arginine translocation signal domain-containing protein [Pseudogemmobacter sp. W21_MBD1_M6]|uniref:twin-arginine translocation signal domain-containing protein n=1 Tax=Pseudogemmobacter sp. W21_MBD1_M6 TaxID=3240271 RepID=UPI003F94A8BA
MADDKTTPSRRDFLKLAGTGAPAAVAALAISGVEAEAAEVDLGTGLRKTEHVKKYLETARF